MKINNKKIILILSCVLLFLCVSVILLTGKTYAFKVPISSGEKLDDIKIINEDEKIIELVSKKIDGNDLVLKYKSLKPGKAYITIYPSNDLYSTMKRLYVHRLGTITYDSYFGDCNNSIVIAISTVILIGTILFLLIRSLIKNIKKNMYNYKNVVYLGLIIFLGFSFIRSLFNIFNYSGVINTIENIINSFGLFSTTALPIIFIVSILVTISNIKLLKNEGFSTKNILGLLLGLLLLFLTIAPIVLGEVLQRATWVNVHDEGGIALYIERFIENYSHIIATYLECILIGMIIIGIKAALHTPKYDKDYVIILGCRVSKNGSVTPLLKSRIDKAIKFKNKQKEKTNKDLVLIASGGKGNDEVISEGEAIKNYLLENGIKEKEIILEDKSTNTYENIKYSYELIKNKDAKIALSTTNYHVFRACEIAYNQGVKLEGMGSNTKSYFWINAFIREFIATLYLTKKYHIITILLITVLLAIMITLTYLSIVL